MSVLLWSLLFSYFTTLEVQSFEFNIVRESLHPDDDLLLKRGTTDCPKSGAAYIPSCYKYNASLIGGCWCQCGSSRGKYTFFEPSIACVDTSFARRKAECDLLFTGETADGPLKFFHITTTQQKSIKAPLNQICSFYYGDKLHTQYLGCDGVWNEIPTKSANDSLEVTPGWSTQLQIKTKTGATLLQNNTGRILRLAVQCGHQHASFGERSTCVLFKVEGQVSCPIPQKKPTRRSATLPEPGPVVTLPPLTTRKEKPTPGSSSEKTREVYTSSASVPVKDKNCSHLTSAKSGPLKEASAVMYISITISILAAIIVGVVAAVVYLKRGRTERPNEPFAVFSNDAFRAEYVNEPVEPQPTSHNFFNGVGSAERCGEMVMDSTPDYYNVPLTGPPATPPQETTEHMSRVAVEPTNASNYAKATSTEKVNVHFMALSERWEKSVSPNTHEESMYMSLLPGRPELGVYSELTSACPMTPGAEQPEKTEEKKKESHAIYVNAQK